jgi:hypothetical protein
MYYSTQTINPSHTKYTRLSFFPEILARLASYARYSQNGELLVFHSYYCCLEEEEG